MHVVTYNVGTSPPDQDLHDLLSLSHNPKNDKIIPDFYVVALQEVKAQPQNMFMAALFDEPWTNACRDILGARDYVKVKSIKLQGLLLSVYSLRRHLLNIREVEAEYTRTGLSGMWVNLFLRVFELRHSLGVISGEQGGRQHPPGHLRVLRVFRERAPERAR